MENIIYFKKDFFNFRVIEMISLMEGGCESKLLHGNNIESQLEVNSIIIKFIKQFSLNMK